VKKGKYERVTTSNKTKWFPLIIVVICASLVVVGCTIKNKTTDKDIESTISNNVELPIENIVEPEEFIPETTTEPEPVVYTATIGAMGDLLMHSPIFNGIVKQEDGSYDFASIFQYIDDNITKLDYAVINLETTLCGTDNGYAYSGYPNFNCPDSIVDGAKNAGFDMLLTANNHSYDTRLIGYKRTIETVRNAGLETLGTYTLPEETKWTVVNVNDINVGMLCYTYAFSVTEDGRPSLNGNPAIAENDLCNYFDYNNLDKFYGEVEAHLAAMENAGAETSMIFIHWGDEYQLVENETQRKIAQKLCDLGVDVIVGGHPHVVQPMDLLQSTVDENHKTVCIYSVGNAVSNQRTGAISYVKTSHTEDGVLFTVTFERIDDGEVRVSDVEVVPTWVYLHSKNGAKEYNIIPLNWYQFEFWQNMFNLDDNAFQKAQDSYYRTMEIVGDGLAKVKEYCNQNTEGIINTGN
jgi:poly-gamma-glutamate synthesis protein (capsule biosynthesis protein)